MPAAIPQVDEREVGSRGVPHARVGPTTDESVVGVEAECPLAERRAADGQQAAPHSILGSIHGRHLPLGWRERSGRSTVQPWPPRHAVRPSSPGSLAFPHGSRSRVVRHHRGEDGTPPTWRRQVRSGELRAVDAVEEHLARLDALTPLNAVVARDDAGRPATGPRARRGLRPERPGRCAARGALHGQGLDRCRRAALRRRGRRPRAAADARQHRRRPAPRRRRGAHRQDQRRCRPPRARSLPPPRRSGALAGRLVERRGGGRGERRLTARDRQRQRRLDPAPCGLVRCRRLQAVVRARPDDGSLPAGGPAPRRPDGRRPAHPLGARRLARARRPGRARRARSRRRAGGARRSGVGRDRRAAGRRTRGVGPGRGGRRAAAGRRRHGGGGPATVDRRRGRGRDPALLAPELADRSGGRPTPARLGPLPPPPAGYGGGLRRDRVARGGGAGTAPTCRWTATTTCGRSRGASPAGRR